MGNNRELLNSEIEKLYKKASTMDKTSENYAKLVRCINTLEAIEAKEREDEDARNAKTQEIEVKTQEIEVKTQEIELKRKEAAAAREDKKTDRKIQMVMFGTDVVVTGALAVAAFNIEKTGSIIGTVGKNVFNAAGKIGRFVSKIKL